MKPKYMLAYAYCQ